MATITSTGRVVQADVPGEANVLRGIARFREAWFRLRQKHGRYDSARIVVRAARRGLVLSGPVMHGRGRS